MTETHLWWYAARAAGVVAWALLTATTLWGVLLATRVLRAADNPAWLRSLHAHLSSLALLMTAVHVGALLLDPYMQSLGFGALAALVPFQTSYRPWALALGIVALYLLVAVALSSAAMRILPRRAWKGLHYTSYAVVAMVAFHAALAGSDTGAWWYVTVSTALIVVTAGAVIVRQVIGSVGAQRRRARDRGRGFSAPAARSMRVAGVTPLAQAVVRVRLEPADGEPTAPWNPGAHLTLLLPGGLSRRYSLCGDPADTGGYDIAVQRSAASAGGSSYIHDILRHGDALDVEPPRNHFPLEPAYEYLFIAGGIGITPILAMIRALPAGRNWRLLYLGRSRAAMPFADALAARHPDRVVIHARDEHPTRLPAAAIAAGSRAQVYACGPAPLLDELSASVPADRLHVERFTPMARPDTPPRPLRVEMPGVGVFRVPADRSVLDVLEDAGAPIAGSCRQGVCGACELRVLAGRPLHRDSLGDDAGKDAAGIMYPCVSRAAGDVLVVDVVM